MDDQPPGVPQHLHQRPAGQHRQQPAAMKLGPVEVKVEHPLKEAVPLRIAEEVLAGAAEEDKESGQLPHPHMDFGMVPLDRDHQRDEDADRPHRVAHRPADAPEDLVGGPP